MTTMRDLFSGTPVINPTFQELAAEDPPHTIYEQTDGAGYIAMSPGDVPPNPEEHPAYQDIAGLITVERAKRAQVRARLEAEENGTYVEPVIEPFDEATFHEDRKSVSSAAGSGVRRADV